MAYIHKRWVRVDKPSIAKIEQGTVNAIRWNAKQGTSSIAKLLKVDARTVQYVLSNPAFMQHSEELNVRT